MLVLHCCEFSSQVLLTEICMPIALIFIYLCIGTNICPMYNKFKIALKAMKYCGTNQVQWIFFLGGVILEQELHIYCRSWRFLSDLRFFEFEVGFSMMVSFQSWLAMYDMLQMFQQVAPAIFAASKKLSKRILWLPIMSSLSSMCRRINSDIF